MMKDVSYTMFLTNRRAMFAVISAVFAMMFMLFYDSILSVRMESMGVADTNIGFMFALDPFFYALSSPFVGDLCKKFGSRYII